MNLRTTYRFFLTFAVIIGMTTTIVPESLADSFNDKVGTRAFPFLKRPIGARPTALAGAFTGLADDESAIFYNPAGVATLKGRRAFFDYQNYIAGINAGMFGYIHPLSEVNSIAGYINYINYGNFVRTDLSGAELGEFGGSSMVFGALFSRKHSEKVTTGVTLKLIYSKLDTYTATGGAIDLGMRYVIKDRIPGFERRGYGSIGLAVQNLGVMASAYTVDAEKDPLPIIIRGGVAGQPRGIPVILSGDVILPTDNDIFFALGAEFSDIQYLSLRLGWNSFAENYKTDFENSPITGFTFGVGFEFKKFKLDYSLTPMNDLGESHRVTVSHVFDDIDLY